MNARHFLNMYSSILECEKVFKNDTCVTISLQAVKTYMAELFITADIQSLSETEFFDLWSSKTTVTSRILRTPAFEKFVREQSIVVILDDELLDLIAEGATKVLKILYDTTKPAT